MATTVSEGFTEGSLPGSAPHTSVMSVLLADSESSLWSTIFASREGLAIAHKVDDAFPQQVAKMSINHDAIAPGDFVVRSVLAGRRRKFEILAMHSSEVGCRQLLDMVCDVECKFVSETLIEFVDGYTMIQLPKAVKVATYRGR